MKRFLLAVLAVLLLGGLPGAWGAQPEAKVEAEVKRIVARVNAVEAQLERAVFYENKVVDEGAGETALEQAWLTESRDRLKVAREWIGKTEWARKEFWFSRSNEPIFVLTRHETQLQDGGTRVEESRRYFDAEQGVLIRELSKDGRFKAGDSLDTKGIKNVARPMAKLDAAERSSRGFREDAANIVGALVEAGPPKRDPGAGAPGDSARFRLIHQSTSPDGRLAVGLGFPEAPKSWDDFYFTDDPDSGTESFWIEDETLREKARNYLVDLATHRIVAEMPAEAFATRVHAGRHGWSHEWSDDGGWMVQVSHNRWTSQARVIRMEAGAKVAGPEELMPRMERAAAAFLTARKDRNFKKVEKDFGIYISRAEITNEGVLTLWIGLCVPGSKEDHGLPDLVQKIRLKAGDGKVGVEKIETR